MSLKDLCKLASYHSLYYLGGMNATKNLLTNLCNLLVRASVSLWSNFPAGYPKSCTGGPAWSPLRIGTSFELKWTGLIDDVRY